ncbi:MAG TPA: 4Fe-4S binding protein [Dehalococcoidia bacterium]|nr:4Fe-4S binding protein [Dehalococcoidia bacterium]
MGHQMNADREYRLLQRRLDKNITGAPESPAFTKILRLLFTPDEAGFVRHIPSRPTPLDVLSRRLGIPEDELGEKLTGMAKRGLMLDVENKGQRYFALPPVVIGFFEYSFMRTGDDTTAGELARLFEQYMIEDDRFAHSVYQRTTQLGRSLVREEALPEDDHIEILDWERASHLIQSAWALGVSTCPCRNKATLLGEACDRPQRTCLTLNGGAPPLIRSGLAESITVEEAMRVLEECKEAGLAQSGDNVQRNVTFICNCCGCCCEMIRAIKTFDIRNAIVSSNWIMEVDLSRCKGCGKCAESCPLGAIEIAEEIEGEKKRRWAVLDETLCMGCGVCYSACKNGGVTMKARPQRVLTPENTFDRIVTMALERGKLANVLFEQPEKLSHRALGRIIGVLENTPPFKAAMAIEPLRSTFLDGAIKLSKRG